MPRKSETQTDVLPDGSIIDLDSYDWGDLKLSKRQKLFVVWYTTPNQNGFKNSTTAAQKAGYTPRSSYKAKMTLLRDNPRVAEMIKKLTDEQIKASVKEAAEKIIGQKIARATYNINDFYETKSVEIETNDSTRSVLLPASAKSLEDIPEEKARLIDNIEVSNNGVVVYRLPNREKEANDILKLNAEMNQEKTTGDYDVETTVDLIKENLATVKTTVRLGNQKIRESAGNYIENNGELPDFD